jgi:hypothetical protein
LVGVAPAMWRAPDAVDVVFHPHLAEFHRRDGDLAIRLEVVVAPADDIEVRHVTIINDGDQVRRLMITTCGEVVLAGGGPRTPPAFSKLCSQRIHPATEDCSSGASLGSPDERLPVAHRFVPDDPNVRFHGIETDRPRLLARRMRSPVGRSIGPTSSASRSIHPGCRYGRHQPSASVHLPSSPPCPDPRIRARTGRALSDDERRRLGDGGGRPRRSRTSGWHRARSDD